MRGLFQPYLSCCCMQHAEGASRQLKSARSLCLLKTLNCNLSVQNAEQHVCLCAVCCYT